MSFISGRTPTQTIMASKMSSSAGKMRNTCSCMLQVHVTSTMVYLSIVNPQYNDLGLAKETRLPHKIGTLILNT